MRGVVFTGDRTLEIMTFDDPTPGPGEVSSSTRRPAARVSSCSEPGARRIGRG